MAARGSQRREMAPPHPQSFVDGHFSAARSGVTELDRVTGFASVDARGALAARPGGGEYLYLSPGVNVRLAERLVAYSDVQVPVMQRVNGIQLTSWWNLLVGLTYELDV